MRTSAQERSEDSLSHNANLVRQAQTGDSAAFAQLYDAYVERVYRYIYFRVSDVPTAEDLTSEVFLKAWQNLGRYQSADVPFLAWLYRIARNQVIDFYRSQKETTSLEDTVPVSVDVRALDAQVSNVFELQALRDSLQLLTEEQQQVLILRFIAGLPTRNIAQMLGKQEGAVRALQMRGLQALSKHMKEEEEP